MSGSDSVVLQQLHLEVVKLKDQAQKDAQEIATLTIEAGTLARRCVQLQTELDNLQLEVTERSYRQVIKAATGGNLCCRNRPGERIWWAIVNLMMLAVIQATMVQKPRILQ